MDTKKLKQKVLDLAIRGKLVPQNPNDEPASKLLERIYAEKQKLIAEGKIKKEKRTSFIFKGEDNSYYEKVVEGGKETIRDITAEIPFDIPESWAWTRLGNVINLYNGYAFKSSEYADDGIPIVRIGDLVDGCVNLDACVRVKQSTLYRKFEIPYGSLLLAMSGATTGKIAINKHRGIIYLNQRVGRIESIAVEEEYIVIFFNNIVSKNLKKAYGCAIPNLSSVQVNETLIPLPPLYEQKRIISTIGKLVNQVSNIDNAYDTLSAKITQTKSKLLDLAIRGKILPQNPNDEPASALLGRIREEQESTKTKRKSIGSYIFKGGDNLYYEQIGSEIKCIQDEIPFDIPNSWAWTRFCDVVDFKIGKTPDRNNDDYWCTGEYPWISISDMNSNSHIYKTKETISEKAFKTVFKENISPVGTLIMSFKLTVGKVSILAIDAIHNEAIISIFPRYSMGNIFRNYLFHILPIISQTGDSHDAIKGVTLNSKSLAKLLLPLPPLREQERISEFLTSAFTKLDLLAQH